MDIVAALTRHKFSARLGPQIFRSSRSSIFWHGKIADRQNGRSRDPLDPRREFLFIVPPRRAGMEPVLGLSCWLWRTRPTSGLGCSASASVGLSTYRPTGRTTPRSPCGEAGADELAEFGRGIEHGVRQKTRSRAGTPDAGALLFNVLLLFGWGYRVTPGVSPGNSPFGI